MIDQLRIANLGVIASAEVPLGPGLTVFTGETGAGKTMVVTALGLLLGARSDASTVRRDAKNASVEAVVRVAADAPAVNLTEEAGGEVEMHDGDADLILARTVSGDGRSRAFAGGRSAPVSVLGAIGSSLVTVHGQNDQLRLKSAAAQRQALDSFAGAELAAVLARYAEVYASWQAHEAEHSELVTSARERLREAEMLQAALEEIDAIDPQPDEDENLKSESVRLGSIEELRVAGQQAHEALTGGDFAESHAATSLVDAAKRVLESVADKDAALGELAARLQEIEVLLSDVANEVASYGASLDEDVPALLEHVEMRRAELNKLIRKYAPSINEVIGWAETNRARLDELHQDESTIAELAATLERERAELEELAGQLTALRRDAAVSVAERIDAELHELAMPDALFSVDVSATDELGPHGRDRVEFLLQPHPGTDPRPVAKSASGGELSRVMLAIEVVLAEVNPVPTFIFDEVDAGVGGKAAVEIGRRLSMLAKSVQVIVVTHLAQVAAFADNHVRILKSSGTDGGFTESDVRALEDSERVVELARMLAGQEDSDSARAHAQELLDSARRA